MIVAVCGPWYYPNRHHLNTVLDSVKPTGIMVFGYDHPEDVCRIQGYPKGFPRKKVQQCGGWLQTRYPDDHELRLFRRPPVMDAGALSRDFLTVDVHKRVLKKHRPVGILLAFPHVGTAPNGSHYKYYGTEQQYAVDNPDREYRGSGETMVVCQQFGVDVYTCGEGIEKTSRSAEADKAWWFRNWEADQLAKKRRGE